VLLGGLLLRLSSLRCGLGGWGFGKALFLILILVLVLVLWFFDPSFPCYGLESQVGRYYL
jgi:hypothetical protein